MRRSYPLIVAGLLAMAGCAVPSAESAVPSRETQVTQESTPSAQSTPPSATGVEPSSAPTKDVTTTPAPNPAATPTPTLSPKPVVKPGPAKYKTGSSGESVRELQARLRQIGWFDGYPTGKYGTKTVRAVSGFQGKRAIPVTGEVDQRTWDRLVVMTRKPTADELKDAPPPENKPAGTTKATQQLDPRCLIGRAMCISKATRTLSWVIDGKVQLVMAVRFGSDELPTREGAFQVGWKSRDHVSSLYHTKMPFAMFFSGGQAVHYSPDFAARGYRGASHGCVNVRNKGAVISLFNQVRNGDKVIVYR